MGRNTVQRLVESNIEALEQLVHFLSGLDEQAYTKAPNGVRFGIGRHVRHVLDMYLALMQGLQSGLVDYDLRARDSRLEKLMVKIQVRCVCGISVTLIIVLN